jgi:hypothetical protein
MRLLAFDPGTTTGLALATVIDKKITIDALDSIRSITARKVQEFVRECDIVICENFLVRPNRARTGAFDWNSMEPVRVIGLIQAVAELEDRKFVLQEPAIKPMGYGWAGLKYVAGKKGMHSHDAVAHLTYYAVKVLHASPQGSGSRGS